MPPRLPPTCTAQVASTTADNLLAAGRRAFSTTPTNARRPTQPRRRFYDWLKKNEHLRRNQARGRPSYLAGSGDRPFPKNPEFVSEPVLAEAARERIWRSVKEEGVPLKAVSAKYGVDVRRIAAVVRMKEVEKEMEKQRKPTAKPFADAVLKMLPTHMLSETHPFESINDIHVHSKTQKQIFVPMAESAHFTREDAAKAFGEKILPPEKKLRVPEMLTFEKNVAEGMSRQRAQDLFLAETRRNERAVADAEKRRRKQEEENKTIVEKGRFEFRFEGFNVDSVGKSGRNRNAVGWRYGVPLDDRKKGKLKIPTKVE
ncbi:hypothetical protein OQA88_4526 [Cercophora sp. LCS_1]